MPHIKKNDLPEGIKRAVDKEVFIFLFFFLGFFVLIMSLIGSVIGITMLEMSCETRFGNHCKVLIVYNNLAFDVCHKTIGNGIVHHAQFNAV